ncbi:MAG: Crp/Fnr family transcriptional regulator, partial [Amylibacter sp.]
QCSLFFESENFCAQLTPDELIDLNRESRTATMKRGDALSDEALSQWPIVAVDSGVLSLQHIMQDGRKTIAALFFRGDIIDLRSISNRKRGNLIALGKTGICRLFPPVFDEIVRINPDAQRIVWDNLREQTFRAIEHSVDLAKKQALEKLASFIFECRHHESSNAIDNSVVSIPIRRLDLAEYIGMQPETVSRCFRELENKDIIELEKLTTVIIKNVPALRRIANGGRAVDETNGHGSVEIKILSFA